MSYSLSASWRELLIQCIWYQVVFPGRKCRYLRRIYLCSWSFLGFLFPEPGFGSSFFSAVLLSCPIRAHSVPGGVRQSFLHGSPICDWCTCAFSQALLHSPLQRGLLPVGIVLDSDECSPLPGT